MSSEDQLRQKFARLVPEAPDKVVQAGEVEARGRAVRRRRTAAVSVAAAAAVAAVVVPLAVGGGPEKGLTTSPPPARSPAPDAADPWTSDPCPANLVNDWATDPMPAEITSVRMCDLPSEQYYAEWSSPLDALVTDIPGFLAAVEALPNADQTRCMTIEPAPPTAVRILTHPDGRTSKIPEMACTDVRVGRRSVEGEAIRSLLLERLAAQRRTTPSAWRGTQPARPCTEKPTRVEVDPSTEEIVAATICHRTGPNQELEGSDLDAIRTAWRSAVRWPEYDRVDRCPGVGGGGHRIVLTTNFGDTLVWHYDSCGDYSEAASTRSAELHLLLDDQTLADLGLPHP